MSLFTKDRHVSNLHMSLFYKEQTWAICWRGSSQKSNVSKSLLSLFKKELREWFTRDSSKLLAKNERFARKICFFWMFLQFFPCFRPKIESFPSLLAQLICFKEQLERWERFTLFCKWIALSLFCSQKTSESLEKLMIKFPTLVSLMSKTNYGGKKLLKLYRKRTGSREKFGILS